MAYLLSCGDRVSQKYKSGCAAAGCTFKEYSNKTGFARRMCQGLYFFLLSSFFFRK
jgi:hypothetical protein